MFVWVKTACGADVGEPPRASDRERLPGPVDERARRRWGAPRPFAPASRRSACRRDGSPAASDTLTVDGHLELSVVEGRGAARNVEQIDQAPALCICSSDSRAERAPVRTEIVWGDQRAQLARDRVREDPRLEVPVATFTALTRVLEQAMPVGRVIHHEVHDHAHPAIVGRAHDFDHVAERYVPRSTPL